MAPLVPIAAILTTSPQANEWTRILICTTSSCAYLIISVKLHPLSHISLASIRRPTFIQFQLQSVGDQNLKHAFHSPNCNLNVRFLCQHVIQIHIQLCFHATKQLCHNELETPWCICRSQRHHLKVIRPHMTGEFDCHLPIPTFQIRCVEYPAAPESRYGLMSVFSSVVSFFTRFTNVGLLPN